MAEKQMAEMKMDLRTFDEGVGNTNTTNELSAEMKTYYSDYLIDNAVPKLVHDQFGQKHPIPKNAGKKIQFREYSPLPKALEPLTEGVTPVGRKLNVSGKEAELKQYGDYIELSDMLVLSAVDNNLVQAAKLLGNQAGETLDTITREELAGGTNVLFATSKVFSRHQLEGGKESENHYLCVDDIKRAVRYLKTQKADKIGDSYVAIIHPDVSYDLMSDAAWQNVKDYDPKDWYEGEIGKIAGCRFVETTEAKVFHAQDLCENARTLSVKTEVTAGAIVTVKEALSQAEANALMGRKVLIGGSLYEIDSASAGEAGAASLTLKQEPGNVAADTVIYPGEAGAKGRDVYATLVLGENAYGITEIEGGGLKHIIKQLGSAGTSDPLNQRATAGWKATRAVKRLVEPFMVRIESASTFESGAN